MRKQYKQKRRTCALCKPHKMGWTKRWKPKERAAREALEDNVDLHIAREALLESGVVAWKRVKKELSL